MSLANGIAEQDRLTDADILEVVWALEEVKLVLETDGLFQLGTFDVVALKVVEVEGDTPAHWRLLIIDKDLLSRGT